MELHRRWTTQPLITVPVDRTNPLCRGMIAVVSGVTRRDAAQSRQVQNTSSGATRFGVYGPVWYAPVSTPLRRQVACPVQPVEFSVACVFNCEGDYTNLQYLVGLFESNTLNGLRIASAGELVFTWGSFGGGARQAFISPSLTNRWCTASASSPLVGSTTGSVLVVDGAVTAGAEGPAALQAAANNTPVSIGGRGFDEFRNFGGQIALAVVWNRVLSTAEHLSFQRDPWRIFTPLRYEYPGVSAAQTMPVLSLAQMINLTTTGGQPRVTAT